MTMELINKADAALYVDVHCFVCNKRMALSNAIQMAGHYLCPKCETEFVEIMNPDTQPICIGCNKKPDQLDEYVSAVRGEDMSPDDYVRSEEGTYNSETGHFLCTECYVKAGMPSSPQGWVAP